LDLAGEIQISRFLDHPKISKNLNKGTIKGFTNPSFFGIINKI
jgi:hypothetical protein